MTVLVSNLIMEDSENFSWHFLPQLKIRTFFLQQRKKGQKERETERRKGGRENQATDRVTWETVSMLGPPTKDPLGSDLTV